MSRAGGKIRFLYLFDNEMHEDGAKEWIDKILLTKNDALEFIDLGKCNLGESFCLKEVSRLMELQQMNFINASDNEDTVHAGDEHEYEHAHGHEHGQQEQEQEQEQEEQERAEEYARYSPRHEESFKIKVVEKTLSEMKKFVNGENLGRLERASDEKLKREEGLVLEKMRNNLIEFNMIPVHRWGGTDSKDDKMPVDLFNLIGIEARIGGVYFVSVDLSVTGGVVTTLVSEKKLLRICWVDDVIDLGSSSEINSLLEVSGAVSEQSIPPQHTQTFKLISRLKNSIGCLTKPIAHALGRAVLWATWQMRK